MKRLACFVLFSLSPDNVITSCRLIILLILIAADDLIKGSQGSVLLQTNLITAVIAFRAASKTASVPASRAFDCVPKTLPSNFVFVTFDLFH